MLFPPKGFFEHVGVGFTRRDRKNIDKFTVSLNGFTWGTSPLLLTIRYL
jgi:hypothetical protein